MKLEQTLVLTVSGIEREALLEICRCAQAYLATKHLSDPLLSDERRSLLQLVEHCLVELRNALG